MLHTSVFDDEISMNEGNDSKILPSLENAYRKACPAVSSMKLAKWARGIPAEDPLEDPPPSGTPAAQSAASEDLFADNSEINRDGGNQEEPPSPTETERVCSGLSESKITVSNTTLSEYVREVLSPRDLNSFDMVLTEPPLRIPNKEVMETIESCKRVLKPGGTFFAILDWLELHVWHNALRDAGFTVMSHPFFMCYATSRIQKTRSASFPQQASIMALVASAPGLRPDKFSTDLSAPYTLINCSHKRKFALIDEIDPPPQPLRKEGSRCHLVKNEKNVKLLCEVMTTFAPVSGSVFDPFGHAMSTPCAALKSGRKCTTLQADEEILKAGVKRLSRILYAGKVKRNFRFKAQQDRACVRSMFEMYEETRLQNSSTSYSDNLESEAGFPTVSPVTPRAPPASNKCNVDGCRIVEEEGQTREMYGHACALCSASVHVLCSERILKITVADSGTPLFCSNFYLKGL